MSFYFQVSVLIYVGFFCFISYITDARRGSAGTSTLLDPLSATFRRSDGMYGYRVVLTIALVLSCLPSARGQAQPPPQAPVTQAPAAPAQGRGGGPAVVSPHLESDGRVTFRVLAPNATTVTVGGDINGGLVPDPNAAAPQAAAPEAQAGRGGGPPAVTMAKGENGVWSGTTSRPVRPGAWRYTFTIDGITVVDSRNVSVTTSQTQVQSLLTVPGDFSETRDVPHGTVGLVRYTAKALNSARREMYVYTPPGYEKGAGRFPVLYLIHGGGDTAVSWSTVGRANHILDNLLAEKKAVDRKSTRLNSSHQSVSRMPSSA